MAIRTILPLLALALAAPASAQGFGGAVPYGSGYTDGFGGPFLRGDYIGAPLTPVPSPTQIVPAPWSYGTYGVPTVSGIAPAPAAQPALLVIQGVGPKGRRRAVAEDRTAGAQVIAVQVPRR
ncbi:hypothetical protein MKK69_17175 [Methylobacterium sp. J-026]|uniref:hypothetical protein n=1 Tax=Methylobacterium sp. J-026 TaxID=2836624 RepID=UPI001FBACEF1|nr:hypothetical protein [Methylobacterium sp. J-026]MCJ2135765.1 hypothetical protein [Methylobacterium sp. J-026]